MSAGVYGNMTGHTLPDWLRSDPTALYTTDDLVEGWSDGGFDATWDARVYRWVTATTREPAWSAMGAAQRHDFEMSRLLTELIARWLGSGTGGSPVAVMGGHSVRRGSDVYVRSAHLGRELARRGHLVITGGGPGVMEAANLGAYLAQSSDTVLQRAIGTLAEAPDVSDPTAYTKAALEVRAATPVPSASAESGILPGGIAVTTWWNSDIPQPANVFCAATAKFLADAFPEDRTLDLCRGRVVFTPGGAGTVQELFQALTKAYYREPGEVGPIMLLGREFWEQQSGIAEVARRLLARAGTGDLSQALAVVDSVEAVLARLGSSSLAPTGGGRHG